MPWNWGFHHAKTALRQYDGSYVVDNPAKIIVIFDGLVTNEMLFKAVQKLKD